MDNLLSTNFPSGKTISPMSMKQPVNGRGLLNFSRDYNIATAPDDNYLKRVLNAGKSPKHYAKDGLDYATTLPPSPKDNITNDPACVTCNKYPNRPFKRGRCYMLYSPQQNIWGPVCGDGGSNANWVRGNRFGVDYEYDKIYNRDSFGIDVPRFIKKNPVIVSDSPYFPFPDYGIRFNPKFTSYPYYQNYVKGNPTYTFPYAPINTQGETQVEPQVVENFDNYEQINNYNWIYIIIVILIVICLIYCMKMKK